MIAFLSLLSLACSVVATPETRPALVGVATAADHNRESHERACERNQRVPGDACTFDTECEVCHDGSSCGTVMHRDRVASLGAACQRDDGAECEPSAPRCCAGRCVIAPL